MTTVLVIVYLLTGILGGDLLSPNLDFAYLFVQVNQAVWSGAVWMLLTSLFLHANLLHLVGNVLFLLIFGTSLEEHVSKKQWLTAYFVSGLAGNVAFLFLGGNQIGLGASGAIWGILAVAGGLKGLVGMMFFIGLNLFAGGGFLAHAGGLLAGLLLRYLWFGKL
jgi:rhomboid protease GluP